MGILLSILLILTLFCSLICAWGGVFWQKQDTKRHKTLLWAVIFLAMSLGLTMYVLQYEQMYAQAKRTFEVTAKQTVQNFKKVRHACQNKCVNVNYQKVLLKNRKDIVKDNYLNNKQIMNYALEQMNENKTLFNLTDYRHAKKVAHTLHRRYQKLTTKNI